MGRQEQGLQRSGLGAERFRILFFGEQGSTMVASRAQAVGEALARQDRRAAGAAFARMVDPLSAWTLARVMAAAVGAAQAAPRTAPATAPHPAAPRPATPPVSPEEAKRQAAALRARNIDNMARVIFTEARGNGRDAMTAVGHTIHNRMIRNEVSEVDKVWGGYRHGAKIFDDPARWEEARRIAAGILDGVIADTTGGATHYYSPNSRTTAPLPAPGQPNAPGHETVPGVIGKDKRPAQNTFPDWSRSSEFQRRLMPGIPEKEFKFYRQTKEGHVR